MFHVANRFISPPSWIDQKKALIAKQIIFKIFQKKNYCAAVVTINPAIDFRSRLFQRFIKFRHHFRFRLISRNRERKGSLTLKHEYQLRTVQKKTAIEKNNRFVKVFSSRAAMLYQLFLKVTFTLSEREYWFPMHDIYDPFFSFQGRMSSMASHIMGKQHKNDIRNLWKIFSVIFNIFPRTAISNGFISNMFDRRANKQNVLQWFKVPK